MKRGGSWSLPGLFATSAFRVSGNNPDCSTGFRVVMEVDNVYSLWPLHPMFEMLHGYSNKLEPNNKLVHLKSKFDSSVLLRPMFY